MYTFTPLDIAVGFVWTWVIGLLPAYLIRNVIVKRPLGKVTALLISLIWGLVHMTGSILIGAYLNPTAYHVQVSPIIGFVASISFLILIWKGNEQPTDNKKKPTDDTQTNKVNLTPPAPNKFVSLLTAKSTLIAALLIALGLGLYAMYNNRQISYMEGKTEHCRKLGEEYREREIERAPDASFLVPTYTYNEELNTCLYSGGLISSDSADKYIIDLNTNQRVASSTIILSSGKLIDGLTIEEFKQREAELFGN